MLQDIIPQDQMSNMNGIKWAEKKADLLTVFQIDEGFEPQI